MRLRPVRVTPPWLMGGCIAVCCGSVILAIGLGLTARGDATSRAMREMAAYAEGLERRIATDFALFDLILHTASGQTGVRPPNIPLPEHISIARYVGFINILNEAGDVIADSRSGNTRLANFAGRDYFQQHLRDPAATAMIGRPFATAPGQNASIPISRRLTEPGGGFSGVVVAGVRLAWLRDILAQPAPGPHPSVTIRRDDGLILMRTPFEPDEIGRGGTADPGWQDWLRSGISTAEEKSGGVHLYRKLNVPALVVEITLDGTEVMAGERSWLAWLLLASGLPGLCALALGILAHRSQRRATRIEAAASRANDERMRLLATMSHELRTPLTGILGQAELLRGEGTLSAAQGARLARLTEAGTLMRDIINRVIDVARPDDQVIQPVLAPCDLDQLIRTCRGMVEPLAREKGLQLSSHVTPSAPRYAMLDCVLMQQVLVNLLFNAIKFTEQGSIELRLDVNAGRMRFEAADTGRGVPAAKRHRLFREYDRLDTRDSAIEGAGLGLSITGRIVQKMGGTIGHLDNPGGGSVFWVELPFTAADPVPVRPPEAHVPAPEPAPRFLRILLADDLDVTRSVTADFLRAAGHAVVETADGEAASHEAQEGDFDVILTDMRMPVCDGLELARRVRALPGLRGRVPIVLVTADLAVRQPGTSNNTGIDLCLMKPFTRAELLTAVESAARLPPVPPLGTPASAVLDDAILNQLLGSLGPETVEAHFQAIEHRIDDLLTLLARPHLPNNINQIDLIDDAVHDLTGVTGLMGLTALSACLSQFNPAGSGPTAIEALQDAAAETLVALRQRRIPAAT